ncbi:MAG: peptidoglycan DD-metalloendopeptidase family protein [Turneriella sp.]
MLVRNSEVTVIEYSDNDDYIDGQTAKWAHVRSGEDLEGWVFSGYLSDEPRPGGGGGNTGPVEDPQHIMSGSSKKVKPPYLGSARRADKIWYGYRSFAAGEECLDCRTPAKLGERRWPQIGVGKGAGRQYRRVGVRWVSFVGRVHYEFDSLDKPFILPLDAGSYRRTRNYGPRTHPVFHRPDFHTGVDLGASEGTPIYAAGDGVIELQNDNTGYGMLTVVRHENGARYLITLTRADAAKISATGSLRVT